MDTPRLQWPPVLTDAPDGGQTLAAVEQDSPEEIRQTLGMLCRLRPGMLAWDRGLGIPDPLGAQDPDVAAQLIQAALDEQDGRRDVTVRVIDDQATGGRQIRLRVAAT